MPTYVADASVAVGWTIVLPYSSACNRLLQESSSLIAPDLVIAEVTNAFFQQAKTGLADRDRLADGLNLLPRWFAELVPAATLRNQAFDLALQLEHPAYDCFYLALALEREIKFVTADNHFLRKATAKGYQKSVMSLDDW
ncbi:MAG: type II toxin-antitoxin system VapC family toxin [Rhizobiaceae bacterium]